MNSRFVPRVEPQEDGTVRFLVVEEVSGETVTGASSVEELEQFEVALVNAGLSPREIAPLSQKARELLRTQRIPSPPGWKEDPLSQFLDTTHINARATFYNYKSLSTCLVQINAIFAEFTKDLIDPEALASPFFFMRAHAAYMSSAGLALSTQLPEAYMVIRGCLESSLYGFRVFKHPESAEIWLKRNENEEALKLTKKAFMLSGTPKKGDPPALFDLLKQDDEEIGNVTQELYERTIDFGAHPNPRSIVSNMARTRQDGGALWTVRYLNSDPNALQLCMKSVAQIGVCSLKIFAHVFPIRYGQLNLTEKIDKVASGL